MSPTDSRPRDTGGAAPWPAARLRAAFLDFFARRGHTVVPSSSLVPARDPTLLFSNAGMNQFKDVFLGVETRSYTRAASSQKCMRVSGKHNDLEQVGYTPRHHTFFEMLGNFSFGDYFKKEAIAFAWELLTGPVSKGCFGLDPDRLQVTVFREDDDAFGFWRKGVGVPEKRISRLGEKDNFWQMGDTGPCGPCSEIHYDRGKDKREGECSQPGCGPGCECGQFMELWNLVFIQYDRQPDGAFAPLKRTGVDTGMGLERIASVLQNVDSNFDTDLFRPILGRILELANERGGFKKKRLEELSLDERRWVQVIADHARAMTFLMSEGVTPSNERRGYVLRLIVRRALRHGRHLGIERPFLCDLSGTVIDGMAAPWIDERGDEHESPYHDLVAHRGAIARMAQREEERFAATVAVGNERAEQIAKQCELQGRKEFPGEEAFKLYDTFGLPLDMIRDVAREWKLKLDEAAFERALAEQRERSRRGIKETRAATVSGALASLPEKRAEFLGYETTCLEDARIVAILRGEDLVDELRVGEEGQVLLDRTPFYAESGGQVGDTGFLTASGGVAEVRDTQAPVAHLNLHRVVVREGRLRPGDVVQAEVDRARRDAIRRSHTATHLAHAALRDIVGTHVKQAGSLVNPDRFRFDFSHYAALTPEIVRQVEDEVNDVIRQDLPIRMSVMPLDEALRRGALAFFGDKYGEQVRVVEVTGFSMELCGGTHTPSTGVIGLFKVIQERGTAAGVRRIETLSGEQALRQFQGQQSVLQDLGSALGVEPAGLAESVRRLQQSAKVLQREVESLRLKLAEGTGSTAEEPVLEVHGLKVLVKKVSGLDRAGMRSLTDRLKQKLGSGVVVLGQVEGEEASLLVAVTRDLAPRLSAGAIIRQLAPIVGGRGGGRDELAEAGGKQGGQLDRALAEVGPAIEKVVGA